MTSVRIPASIKDATERLGAIERLLTAREWEKAAIVAAFVRLDSEGGRNSRKPRRTARFMSAREFAELDITGLRGPNTVTLYVQRWLDAHDGVYPEPGAQVELPDLDWPPEERNLGSRLTESSMTRAIKEDPKMAAAAIAAVPVDALAKAVVDDEVIDTAVSRERLDRVVNPTARQGLRASTAKSYQDLEDTEVASQAALADHVDHPVDLDIASALLHLRRAVVDMDKFTYISEAQMIGIAARLEEAEHLIALLKKGGSTRWSTADRSFLDELGVEL